MKKSSIVFMIALCTSAAAQDRFFRGFGVFGAGTQSFHRYINTEEHLRDHENDHPLNFNPAYRYPQSHFSREFFSWSAGLFAEFGRRDARWQTELEYANKGARERELIDIYTGTRSDSWQSNRNTYIQWNNYLKWFGPLGLPSSFYLMPGIRLEYKFRNSSPVFTRVSSNFPTFWFSGNVGIGHEFPLFRRINWFTEYHWNPDIIYHRTDNIRARSRTFELRVGLVYRPRTRSIDDCNAPRYRGPAY